MQLHTHTPSTSTSPSPGRPSHHTLDSFARLGAHELAALYRDARVSTSMHAADGALRGRMLAIRGAPSPIARRIARWAASPAFVWEGKTFQASNDRVGVGLNRVRVNGVLGRQDLFHFTTSFGPSAIDGAPSLILDYDLDRNPDYIRHVHDEIREVEPGLFLGPAMWKRGAAKTLVLWFALDARWS